MLQKNVKKHAKNQLTPIALKQAGITLIALVITIVVLLILAGVTINTVLSDDGIFKKAQESANKWQVETERDRLNLIVTNWQMQSTLNNAITEKDLIKAIVDSGLVDGESSVTGENGKYTVKTKTGNTFEITIDKQGNVNIENIGTGNKVISSIDTITVTATTTKSVTIQVDIKRPGKNETYTYESKKENEEKYTVNQKESNSNTYTFDNLEQGVNYDIKVTYTSSNGTVSKETTITTNQLKSGTIQQDGETTWDETTHTATIKLKTTEELPIGTNLEYQVDSTEGTWNLYQESGIPNLNHGSTVFTRLYDGKNASKESGISIIDGIEPKLATISEMPTSAAPGATLTATVTHRDKQSGINLNNCKWIFNNSVSIDKEDSAWNSANTFESSTNQISITVPSDADNYYLHVLSVDVAGKKRVTTSVQVKVKLMPIIDASKPNGNQSPIQNGYGKIDVIWLDENNHVIAEPKAPILGTEGNKMTPIKWNNTTLVDTGVDETNPEITKADGTKEKDWYDYENHRWANARTNNQSYFVWIPRYAYRITYYESKEKQETPVGYCDGYGMWRTNGTLEYKLDGGIETVEAADGNLYIVHPAFGAKQGSTEAQKTQNINNGGWGDTLTGFWFAKFEMSGENGATLKSSPEGKSIRSKAIGEFYTMGRTATYGQTGTVDSTATDGITVASFMNSHMVKNSEWGAVAYLTHSKFGLNGEEVAINGPSDNGTGGGTSATSYLSNQNQSTTANPYGIYDMSGGAYEYTAAFNNIDSSNYFINWTSNTKLTTSSNSTKYATKYENNPDNEIGNTIYTVCKTGDATKEVYLGDNRPYAWYGDFSGFAYSIIPFFTRGGYYGSDDDFAGVFSSAYDDGYHHGEDSFRAALAPFSL